MMTCMYLVFALLAVTAVCVCFFYARFWEPRRLQDTRLSVNLRNKTPGNPVCILHLSDMHASGVVPLSFIEKAVDIGLSNRPDLICLTGDMITHHIPDKSKYLMLLKKLSSTASTYACVGNHDGGSWAAQWGGYHSPTEVLQLFRDAGIECLFNTSTRVSINGNLITLVGLADYWSRDIDPEKAFTDIVNSPDSTVILLSHNPDSKALLSKFTWDLMLCGHTHGGQMRMPIVGTPFAPVRDKRYVEGLCEWNGRQIHITRGIGNLGGIRINCPPEISILYLTSS